VNPAVDQRLTVWEQANLGTRIWEHDPTVWGAADAPEVTNRLGWLSLPEGMTDRVSTWTKFADTIRSGSFSEVLLLGMGGSSLAPEMFQAVLGNTENSPFLQVLDSTHPDAVLAMAERLDLERTLIVVSSKSGGTLETLSLFRYFFAQVSMITDAPGDHFVAITDPGSSLETLATERAFRAIFRAPPDVGGRYSALCDFGMVPAALIGADVNAILGSARRMADSCGPEIPVRDNPGLLLGAWMGEAAVGGMDKLTVLCSDSLRSFAGWLEQLVAESTGKMGVGIVPVAGEPVGGPEDYGSDRVFLSYHLAGDDPIEGLSELVDAGADVISFELAFPEEIGAEMYRAEFATSAAGVVLGVNPFDQPDVEAAKVSAHLLMTGEAAKSEPISEGTLQDVLGLVHPGDTVALQAYLPITPELEVDLAELQGSLRAATGAAVTVGIGPRFLHSTGQLHKGGPQALVAVQFLSSEMSDVAVPETDISFGEIISAQADGDAQVLIERGMRLIRLVVNGVFPVLE
jgi:transaldolase/glucose-6-phosphate isomerase